MNSMKGMETEALLEMYVEAAQKYIDEIRGGTARAANRYHSVADRVFKELKRRGAERKILPLLSHPRPAVRLWAAIYALDIEPESAQRVLEYLAENAIPIIQIYASDALEDFHGGESS